jgi:hypothetical protein
MSSKTIRDSKKRALAQISRVSRVMAAADNDLAASENAETAIATADYAQQKKNAQQSSGKKRIRRRRTDEAVEVDGVAVAAENVLAAAQSRAEEENESAESISATNSDTEGEESACSSDAEESANSSDAGAIEDDLSGDSSDAFEPSASV